MFPSSRTAVRRLRSAPIRLCSTSFLPSLKERLRISSPVEGLTETYNLSLLNALVMYIGVSSVAQAKARNGTALFAPSDPGVVALQYLANSLDAEGKRARSRSCS